MLTIILCSLKDLKGHIVKVEVVIGVTTVERIKETVNATPTIQLLML